MNEGRLDLEGEMVVFRSGGHGPLIVLSHALGPLAWGGLEALQGRCTVAIPDWEASTLSEDARFDHDWFEPLVRQLGFEQAALGAWSMSGPSAIRFAAEAPPSLARLVLVDVAGLGPGLPRLRLRDLPHLLMTRLLGRPTRRFVSVMWRGWVHRQDLDTRELEAATYRFFRDQEETSASADEDDEGEEPIEPLEEVLASIAVPTLVLVGEHSTVLGPVAGKAAVEKLPAGRMVVFSHSSHTLQLEEPEVFERAVADFVDEPERG